MWTNFRAIRIPLALDAVNFFLANMRGRVVPYLNVFLVTINALVPIQSGLVTTLGGILAIASQTQAGAAIDATRAKRGAIVLGLVVLSPCAIVLFLWPSFSSVAIFRPAVAALTLGRFVRHLLAMISECFSRG